MVEKVSRKRSPASKLTKLLNFDLSLRDTCHNSTQLTITAIRGVETTAAVLIGLDEVGRGCLAGPVVAAAVVLPEIKRNSDLAKSLCLLDDSKTLAAKNREAIAEVIRNVAVHAICEASVEEIDQLNILQASLLAMKRARQMLAAVSPAVLVIDGNKKVPGLEDRQITVVKGDGKSACIAAASVIAKVYRDSLMTRLSETFPQYLWHSNKGYGSEDHRLAIDKHGLTPWHRRSFC